MKKDGYLKLIVTAMLLFLLIFTAVCLILFYATGGMEPSTLIGCVFGAIVGELSICGVLQRGKNKVKNSEEETDGTIDN